MTSLCLTAIKDSMDALLLNYGFLTYEGDIDYPYFVGEYTETESFTEDGEQDATFMLTGFSRGEGAYMELEEAKDSIQEYFGNEGKVFTDTAGNTVVIMYGYSFPVPKDVPDIKSIQINLTVKEWKVI